MEKVQQMQQSREKERIVNFANEKNRKLDDGKARYDLIPAAPLQALAEVYTFGAKKYEDRGWEKGIKWSRIFAAIMRHLWAFWRGETVDRESGLPHAAHAAFGCFALMEFAITHRELDDRPGRIFIEPLRTRRFGEPNEDRPAKTMSSEDLAAWRQVDGLLGKVFIPESERTRDRELGQQSLPQQVWPPPGRTP